MGVHSAVHILLFQKYHFDISGIIRKLTAKDLIGEADFLIKFLLPFLRVLQYLP